MSNRQKKKKNRTSAKVLFKEIPQNPNSTPIQHIICIAQCLPHIISELVRLRFPPECLKQSLSEGIFYKYYCRNPYTYVDMLLFIIVTVDLPSLHLT